MPFKSKAQQRFAYGTGQPWAKEWSDKTNYKKLPQRVKHKKKVSKMDNDPFGISKAVKDMSAYHEKEWRTKGEGKTLRRARLKNAATFGAALGAGAIAAKTGNAKIGAASGAFAALAGGSAVSRSINHENIANRPYNRYKKAGGTDSVAPYVNHAKIHKSAFGVTHEISKTVLLPKPFKGGLKPMKPKKPGIGKPGANSKTDNTMAGSGGH